MLIQENFKPETINKFTSSEEFIFHDIICLGPHNLLVNLIYIDHTNSYVYLLN